MRRRLLLVLLVIPATGLVGAVLTVGVGWPAKLLVVPSSSMLPTLTVGQHVIAWRIGTPGRFDLVAFHPNGSGDQVFRSSTAATPFFVKRLIGLPGEEVGSRHGAVWVCAARVVAADLANPTATRGCRYLSEPYLHGEKTWEYGTPEVDLAPIKIPAGAYLMLGDNRENSNDGRNFGAVEESQIVGRVFTLPGS